MQFLSWTSGWKTYVTVIVGVGFGLADYFNYPIPHLQTIEIVLGFMGIGFGRMAISGQSKQTAQDLGVLIQNVLSQVTVPPTVTVTGKDGSSTTVSPTPVATSTTETTTVQPAPAKDPFFNKGGAKH